MFLIYPAHDDFYYVSPKPGINIVSAVMTPGTFWRPFDSVISWGLGYAPYLFPYLNHVAVLTAHLAVCMILFIVLKKLAASDVGVRAGMLFFCLSQGTMCTLTNTDYINQILAFLSGLAGSLCFLQAVSRGKKFFYILWFILAFLSVIFKENGIAWFLAPVLLKMIYDYSGGNEKTSAVISKNYIHLAVGAAGMLLYFALRFALAGKVALGSETGRYAIIFSPVHIIMNYCLILGGAATSADLLALILKPSNLPVFAVSVAVSIVFLSYMAICIYDIFRNRRKIFWLLSGLFVCGLYISGPYAVMGKLQDAANYEAAFMLSLIIGIIISNCARRKFMLPIFTVMMTSMLCTSAHKLYVMHDYTSEVKDFLIEHRNDFAHKPSKVFVFYIEDVPHEGYSVYRFQLGHGLSEGIAFNSLWDWEAEFKVRRVKSEANINILSGDLTRYDTVFSLTRSGKIKVLRN